VVRHTSSPEPDCLGPARLVVVQSAPAIPLRAPAMVQALKTLGLSLASLSPAEPTQPERRTARRSQCSRTSPSVLLADRTLSIAFLLPDQGSNIVARTGTSYGPRMRPLADTQKAGQDEPPLGSRSSPTLRQRGSTPTVPPTAAEDPRSAAGPTASRFQPHRASENCGCRDFPKAPIYRPWAESRQAWMRMHDICLKFAISQ
jgi:hypothetical protein